MLTLPDSLRDAFKEPLGPVTTDADELLAAAAETRGERAAPDAPIIAVGDVVTYHLREAGRVPDVALIDGRTKREATTGDVAATLQALDADVTVPNAPGTLSADLIEALSGAIESGERRVIAVDGEEDLAALPAVVLAPDGATVVYGQPDEGMVRIAVDDAARDRARDLLERFDADERLWRLLD